MKVLLQVYTHEWASTAIAAAWLELTKERLGELLRLKELFETIKNTPGLDLMTLTFLDNRPDFLAPSWSGDGEDEEEYYFIDERGEEQSIYDVDEWVILRDDQAFPEEYPQDMTITYLNVERFGVWWESRDDRMEDKVETAALSWEVLAQWKARLEGTNDLPAVHE